MFNKMVLTLAACIVVASPAFAQVIGSDDFDGGENFLTRTLTPDNSANGGTFPNSIFDVFGIVDRTVNLDFSDDTLIDTTFTGMLPTTVTDSFFGSEDLDNPDNMDGTASIVYEFDVAGATGLSFSADFAAWGDFEPSDLFEVSASIDGSAAELILEILVDDDGMQTYTYEDGSTEDLNDPMTIQGVALDNNFQNFSAPIAGTGSMLTLSIALQGNGGNEVIAMNNLEISAGGGGGGDCPSGFALGDVNQDGAVTLLDVQPFVDAITNGLNICEADINQDGLVDLLDVAGFVTILQGG